MRPSTSKASQPGFWRSDSRDGEGGAEESLVDECLGVQTRVGGVLDAGPESEGALGYSQHGPELSLVPEQSERIEGDRGRRIPVG